jgi:hypothetical protein
MKYFALAALGLAMTVGASAATFNETCTSVAGGNGSTSFAATQLTCPQFNSLPAGMVLQSVTLSLEDSFNQGVTGQTNGFDFTYTFINPDVFLSNSAFPVNSCIAAGVGSSATCEDQVTGTLVGASLYQLGNVITTDLAAYLGGGNFNVGAVAGSIDSSINPFSSLNASGQLGSTAFASFTYGPSGSTPEPGSLMLLGSGLVAFAFAGRKLVRK